MRRIVSLLPGATEMLFALGAGEQLVGVSHECNFPPAARTLPQLTHSNIDSSQSSEAIDQQVRAALADSQTLYALDAARMAELRPDLIVTQSQCDVCAIRLDDVRAVIAATPELSGAELITLAPNSLQDVFDDMQRLSIALGHSEAQTGNRLGPFLERVQNVRQATAVAKESPRVTIVEWLEPPMVAGNWTPELAAAAGGLYGLAKAGEHSPYVTWDSLINYQPEVLIIAPCGFDLPRTIRDGQAFVRHPRFRELPVAAANRVFFLDGDAYLNRSGPRLVDTLEILAHLIHPELVANLHPNAWRRLQAE